MWPFIIEKSSPLQGGVLFLFNILFIYLREKEKERAQAGMRAEGEADSPLSREPNVRLHPRTLGS